MAGIYVSKFGLKKTLFTLCCIFNLPFVAYTFLAVAQPTNVYLIGTCITMEYFGYGFGFVGLTLFMMQQIAPGKHQMSHYAFASGIMNLGLNNVIELQMYADDCTELERQLERFAA